MEGTGTGRCTTFPGSGDSHRGRHRCVDGRFPPGTMDSVSGDHHVLPRHGGVAGAKDAERGVQRVLVGVRRRRGRGRFATEAGAVHATVRQPHRVVRSLCSWPGLDANARCNRSSSRSKQSTRRARATEALTPFARERPTASRRPRARGGCAALAIDHPEDDKPVGCTKILHASLASERLTRGDISFSSLQDDRSRKVESTILSNPHFFLETTPSCCHQSRVLDSSSRSIAS